VPMIRAWPVQLTRWPTGEKRLSDVPGTDTNAGYSGRGRNTEKTPQSVSCVVEIGNIPQGRIHDEFSRVATFACAWLTVGWIE